MLLEEGKKRRSKKLNVEQEGGEEGDRRSGGREGDGSDEMFVLTRSAIKTAVW